MSRCETAHPISLGVAHTRSCFMLYFIEGVWLRQRLAPCNKNEGSIAFPIHSIVLSARLHKTLDTIISVHSGYL